jgi:hypothetical protein
MRLGLRRMTTRSSAGRRVPQRLQRVGYCRDANDELEAHRQLVTFDEVQVANKTPMIPTKFVYKVKPRAEGTIETLHSSFPILDAIKVNQLEFILAAERRAVAHPSCHVQGIAGNKEGYF